MCTQDLVKFASIFESLTLKDDKDAPLIDFGPENFIGQNPMEPRLEPLPAFGTTYTDIKYTVTGDSDLLAKMRDSARKGPWSKIPRE